MKIIASVYVGAVPPGTEVDLDEIEARDLIAQGYARPASAPQGEPALSAPKESSRQVKTDSPLRSQGKEDD